MKQQNQPLKIFYLWPGRMRWRNNVLGQRPLALKNLGQTIWITLARNANSDTDTFKIFIKVPKLPLGEALNFFCYVLFTSAYLTWLRLLGKISGRDVVYTNFEISSLVGIYAKNILRMRWVVDFFDDPRRSYLNAISRNQKLAVLHKLVLIIFSIFIKTSDHIICVGLSKNEGIPRYVRENLNVEDSKILVVPNGTDSEWLTEMSKKYRKQAVKLLNTFGVEGSFLYYVGHINNETSGVYNLLEAFDVICQSHKDIKLVLAGFINPNERQWFDSLIDLKGIKEKVIYLGVVNQDLSYALMGLSRICLCVYQALGRDDYQNAIPIKLLEYIALNKPVVVTKTRMINGLIHKGFSLEPVEAGSPDALAEAILIRLERDLEKSSLKKFPKEFEWASINARIIERLYKLLD